MIHVDGVTVGLGGTRILDTVSVSIERGRLVGLVGPNGAGKTTLLRTINGRIDPDAGDVLVDGERIAGLSTREIGRRVATVPQETALSFDFDVRTVVEMGRHPHRGRLSLADPGADRVAAAMERTTIDHLADRPITAVSGGERQRVLLARALAQDTPVLLLDEPTASLDVNHQVATLELVRGLADEGKTVLAAIHDLDLAARYCDELRLLADGRIRASGPPSAVLGDDGLGDAFDTRVAVTQSRVTGTPTVTALPEHVDRSGRVHVVCGGGSGANVLYPLVAAGYDVTVGPLHESDVDADTADLLGLDATLDVPYGPFDDETVAAAADAARSADVVVVADLDVGADNARALDVAAAGERLVVVDERPFGERNYAGAAAARTFAKLRDGAIVVDESGVIDAVIELLQTSGERTVAIDE